MWLHLSTAVLVQGKIYFHDCLKFVHYAGIYTGFIVLVIVICVFLNAFFFSILDVSVFGLYLLIRYYWNINVLFFVG